MNEVLCISSLYDLTPSLDVDSLSCIIDINGRSKSFTSQANLIISRGITQNRTLFIGNSQNRTLFGYPQDRTLFFTSYKRNTRRRMNQARAAFLRNKAIRRWLFKHERVFILLHFNLESVPLLHSVQFRPPGTSLIV